MNTLAAPVSINLQFAHQANAAKAQNAALPAGSIVSIHRSPQDLQKLEQDWRALSAESSATASVFQNFDWISQWCSSHLDSDKDSNLLVVTGHLGNRLVFVWPLMKTRVLGLTAIQWLSFPTAQYGDILIAKGLNAQGWQEAAIDLIKRTACADVMHLRHVRKDSTFNTFATTAFISADNPEGAPFMDLTQFKSAQEYEARYTPSQRKRRKKIRKDLESFGPVEFKRLAPGPETDRAIAAAIAEKNAWLNSRGRINRIMECPKHLAFLQNLARQPAGQVETVVTEMTCGGTPVSWEIGFRQAGTHFGYITSHVNAQTDFSPGRLHMHYSQVLAVTDGMSRFDLMVPNDVHKESWSSDATSTQDYFLPLSRRGKIAGNIYLRFVRPMLRSIYYKLTPTVLKFAGPLGKKFS